MELKSYQRAFLRSQAQQLNPIVYVGKEGFTEGVSASLDAALTAHELVKVRFSNKKSEVEDISRKLETATLKLANYPKNVKKQPSVFC